MRGLWTILKKEFTRFFKDKKLWLTMLLPGVFIYAIYSVLGTVLQDQMTPSSASYSVLTMHPSEHMEELTARMLAGSNYEIEYVDAADMDGEEAKQLVKDGMFEAFLSFPENFDSLVGEEPETPLDVYLYYNSGDTDSSACYSLVTEILASYKDELFEPFRVNHLTAADLAEPTDIATMAFSMIVPYLLLIFVISGAMSITPESVAGEKERGTIATILVTPVRRSYVAIGKILALSAFSLIGATSSFLGTVLSLPKLMGLPDFNLFDLYSFGDVFGMFLLLLSYVPFIVGLMSVLSTLAKSVKEATSSTSVVMILSMVCGLSSMLGLTPTLWMAFVPILNVAVGLSAILSGTASFLFSALSFGANIVYVVLLVFLLAKLFDSEKVML